MSSRVDRGIQLRAQEILLNSKDPMSTIEAVKRALLERHGEDPQVLLEVAAIAIAGLLKDVRKSSYNLPDENGQLTLGIDVPQLIVIATEQGDLAVPRSQAKAAHVRQWQREGQQHHAVQASRFRRLGKDLEMVEDIDGDASYDDEMLPALIDRKTRELESGE